MRNFALAVLCVAQTILSVPVVATEPERPASAEGAQTGSSVPQPPPAESALSKAARENKARRAATSKKGKSKVITNADVKKSTGKIVVREEQPGLAEVDVNAPRLPTLREHEENLKARRDAADALAAAEKKAEALEKELRLVEQSFYDENDPSYRDDVIQKRFDQIKRQLDAARQELANARDAYQKADEIVTPPLPAKQ